MLQSWSKTAPELVDVAMGRKPADLVIRNGTLAPGDARLDDTDVIEVRPVISGG